jgi:ubiquinol-cytochrome c reductase iron-sulfur subunit
MTAKDPCESELAHMNRDQLAQLAAELSDVEVVANIPQWPVAGARTERWAERSVALWFALSALSAIAFVVTFSIGPHEYVSPLKDGYTLYTPVVVGSSFAFALLAPGIGMIEYYKKFLPEEVSVQQRHDGPSGELARKTVAAQYEKTAEDTGIPRRSLITRAALGATRFFGIAAGVLAIGGLIRNPWKGGNQAALWITGWKPLNGETVYLRTDTGVLARSFGSDPTT